MGSENPDRRSDWQIDHCELEATAPSAACPAEVDWHEVAAGLWPEMKTRQLIAHAARCGHCGPLLRAATSIDDEPTPQEEEFLVQLKAPSCPAIQSHRQAAVVQEESGLFWQRLMGWKVFMPVAALLTLVATIATNLSLPTTHLSGLELSRFAVSTHEQRVRGELALDVYSDSEPQLNEWLGSKSQLAMVLPVSSEVPADVRPYRLQGARLIHVHDKAAAYIAYEMQSGPVGLIVAPDSVAIASGGTQADFRKVSFHYGMLNGYKVVTWSVHGLTYALVSQEGTRTQVSCMVCHSIMKDRDLSHTPTPLSNQRSLGEPVWQ